MINRPGMIWNFGGGGGGFWLAPVILGGLLIGFGVMIFVVPKLLEFIVAGVLIMAGIALAGTGLRMRGGVRYRRFDEEQSRGGVFFDEQDSQR